MKRRMYSPAMGTDRAAVIQYETSRLRSIRYQPKAKGIAVFASWIRALRTTGRLNGARRFCQAIGAAAEGGAEAASGAAGVDVTGEPRGVGRSSPSGSEDSVRTGQRTPSRMRPRPFATDHRRSELSGREKGSQKLSVDRRLSPRISSAARICRLGAREARAHRIFIIPSGPGASDLGAGALSSRGTALDFGGGPGMADSR